VRTRRTRRTTGARTSHGYRGLTEHGGVLFRLCCTGVLSRLRTRRANAPLRRHQANSLVALCDRRSLVWDTSESSPPTALPGHRP